MDFVIRSFGGIAFWEREESNVSANSSAIEEEWRDESDERITHHIVDRPKVRLAYKNRDYIQPQWVFDCVNEGMLLPVEQYLPGIKLPPHLSPFVDDEEVRELRFLYVHTVQEGYTPIRRLQLEKMQAKLKGLPTAEESNEIFDYSSEVGSRQYGSTAW